MTVASIQSSVAFGYVGNAVAVPALQALGQDVWRIDTVRFSNHPGHGQYSGSTCDAEEIAEILAGLDRVWQPRTGDAILSGYLGQAATAEVIAAAVRSGRRLCSGLRYLLDPVIGDDGRIFVNPDVPAAIRQWLLPLADVVLPNVSELGWLSDRRVDSQNGLIAAARTLLDQGPGLIIVTGVRERDRIAVYAVDRTDAWRADARYRNRKFNGTGDLFAALFTGYLLRDGSVPAALSAATAGLDLVTGVTERRQSMELVLVPALGRLGLPGMVFPSPERYGSTAPGEASASSDED